MTPKKALIVACVLLAAALPVSWWAGSRLPDDSVVTLARPLAEAVPLEFAGWTGRDEEITEAERQVLQTDDVLKRSYSHPDVGGVSLFVSFYGNKERGMQTLYHNATVCYPAQGFTHEDTELDEVVLKRLAKQVPVCRYRFDKGATSLSVLCFFKIDDELLDQSPRNKPFWLLVEKLTSNLDTSAGSFVQVQVVARIRDGDEFSAKRLQARFLEDFSTPLFAAIEAPGASQ